MHQICYIQSTAWREIRAEEELRQKLVAITGLIGQLQNTARTLYVMYYDFCSFTPLEMFQKLTKKLRVDIILGETCTAN